MIAPVLVLVALFVSVLGESAREHIDLFKGGDLSRALSKYSVVGRPWSALTQGFREDFSPFYKGMMGRENTDEQRSLVDLMGRLNGRMAGHSWQPIQRGVPQQVPQMMSAFNWNKPRLEPALPQPYPVQQFIPLQIPPSEPVRPRVQPLRFLPTHGIQDLFSGSINDVRYAQPMQSLMMQNVGERNKQLAEAQLADSLAIRTLQQAYRQPIIAAAAEEVIDEVPTSSGIVNINSLLTDPAIRMSQLRPDLPCLHVNLESALSLPHPTNKNSNLDASKAGYMLDAYNSSAREMEGVSDFEGNGHLQVPNTETLDKSNFYQGADSSSFTLLSKIKKGHQLIPESIRKNLEKAAIENETAPNSTEASTNNAEEETKQHDGKVNVKEVEEGVGSDVPVEALKKEIKCDSTTAAVTTKENKIKEEDQKYLKDGSPGIYRQSVNVKSVTPGKVFIGVPQSVPKDSQKQVDNQWEVLQQAIGSQGGQMPLLRHPIALPQSAEKNILLYQNIRDAVNKANQRSMQNNKIAADVPKSLLNEPEVATKITETEKAQMWKGNNSSSRENVSLPSYQDEVAMLRARLTKEVTSSAQKYLARILESSKITPSRFERESSSRKLHKSKQH